MKQNLDTKKILILFEKEGSVALAELKNDFLSGNIPEQMISYHKGLFYFDIAQKVAEAYNWVLNNVEEDKIPFELINKLKESGLNVRQVYLGGVEEMGMLTPVKTFPLVAHEIGNFILVIGSSGFGYILPVSWIQFIGHGLRDQLELISNLPPDEKNVYISKIIQPAIAENLQTTSDLNRWNFSRLVKGEIQFSDKPVRSRQTQTTQPTPRTRINFDAANPDDIIPKNLTDSRKIFEAVIQDIRTIMIASEYGLDIPQSRSWAIEDVDRLLLQAQRSPYFHLEKALGIRGRVSDQQFMALTLSFAETIVDAIRGDAKAKRALEEAASRVK